MFNVKRNIDAPESLAKRNSYSEKDVFTALNKIFHKKCYICETKEPLNINIEHFIAHRGNEDIKYDWENLYLACGRCNNIKLAKFNDLIDCCDDKVDVIRAIKHLPPHTPYAKELNISAQKTDEKTLTTTKLIQKVFNSTHTINKEVTSSYLRKNVFYQFNKFRDLQITYFDELTLDEKKQEALDKMKLLLKASSPYTAFISWCVLEDEELKPLLEDFICN
ncbi:HNH endonuclease [Pseudoalteromonas sp. Angola-7]|uniref:HNH endonuclease n=1 Tax=Pseudoalteromonas sp. Angola-7 TaxID=3025336 RepID=UPI002358C98A|nr:HNH endonuclease [Pseudoalteromonas sp. Angola-7]MDC9529173.1 HNH endonuclease [Pseudoalteromonas sp. Angola-7]